MGNSWSIFVDLDGTMFSHKPSEWEKNVNAFHNFCHDFELNRFIATGRHPTHLGQVLGDVSLTEGGMVLLNGGLVACDGEIISEVKYNDKLAREVYDFLFQKGYSFFMYTKDRVRYTDVRKLTHEYPRYVDEYKGRDMSIPTRIKDFEAVLFAGGVYKFLIITEPSVMDLELVNFLNQKKLVHGFSFPTVYEINPNGINKGFGVEQLTKHLSLDVNKTICIGDGENDIGLFETCKLSVAMENGAPKLKEIATQVSTQKGFMPALNILKTLLMEELLKK